LASPTVVVTAAHCTFGDIGQVLVTFDTDIAQTPAEGAVNVPRAADDTGNGISRTGFTTAPEGWYLGTPATHPDYSDFTDLDNWNDTGVVVLAEPITGITPAPLAPTNYLEQFRQPALNSTLFDVVGYGTRVAKPESGPQKPTPLSYPLIRRYTTSPGQKLTPQILQLNGNGNDNRGGGGTCFGDSGGPVFLNGFLVGDTSYGYTANCRYLGGYQRVDIPVVQDWLATFGLTPAA
jgi:Trypsin